MVEYLISSLMQYGDREIFLSREGGDKGITSKQFMTDIQKSCSFWRHRMEGTGHHIGILAENSYLWLVHCMGIVASGNIMVAFNPYFSEADILDYITRSDTEVMLYDGDMEDYGECGQAVSFIKLSEAFYDGETERVLRDADDVVLMYFSSGTSGKSKVVQVTNKSVYLWGKHYRDSSLNADESFLIPLPLYHVGGLFNSYDGLIIGNRLLISSAKYIQQDIKRGDITRAVFVPAMLKMVLEQIRRGSITAEQIKSLTKVNCLGAVLPEKTSRQVEALGIRMQNGYGMTEFFRNVACTGAYREGTVGKTEPYAKIKIVDGEIVVRSETVMKGYYKDAEATAGILKDGWLYTGDMGQFDEDGYLYVQGRKKNIIILSNGENVNPEVLETKLYECPLIMECRVYGSEDSIKADIFTPRSEEAFEERKTIIENHIKIMNKNLLPMHRIRIFNISENELEKTASGKIKRGV